ncbi:chromatin-remodeling ATPase [Martiniozyma asiatica (nom. inval.)]|nr:chromatin-remodeling ATPase [Martiniozyma asiatica]
MESEMTPSNWLPPVDQLMHQMHSRLNLEVQLDDAAQKASLLHTQNLELQLMATTPGVYVPQTLSDNVRYDINVMDSRIADQATKRSKQIKSEKRETDFIKRQLLAQAVDFQSIHERERLIKLDPTLDDKIEELTKINPYLAVSTQSNLTATSTANDQLNSTLNDHNPAIAFDQQAVCGKRRRKPTSRAEEMVNVDDLENAELFSDEDEDEDEKSFDEDGFARKKRRTSPLNDDEYHDSKRRNGAADGFPDTAPIKTNSKLSGKELKALERQYDNTYLSIWKDLSRKDGPKAYRLFQQTSQAKVINLRKTAQLASRESIRWQVKTTKTQKDQITKARRCMREMLNYWKKNERDEKSMRQKAEQEAQAKAKKEEEEREARRQARKLNFLINQTELYSHFIGRKIKTSEIEGDMSDKSIPVSGNDTPIKGNDDDENIDISKATKDFNSVNFDDGNDEELQKMAAANAQAALMEAKAKAQAFNNNAQQSDTDENEGEMNFQNPSSFGDMKLEQPSLLNCTLKEYQRKGLNWLANLYEQGINGILADEMGLGKTVQSISVLAYLAETHKIWGPFLVVTPSSTLHNWQQEISKFVPDFKVIPYWGTSKDRKVLRKFWDRKNVVYNKDSPFHVVVTSYQLAVQDAAYLNKMKWQYMILDEAQAIKSSQSSRWKILLGLECRNRLLLTGTPIQNNMQELWALLHFIMPSLFDSHDEFSEWFSKDIEAHAQSNSKLNEEQLRRLHAILKPFMLRRIKKNVQTELGDKIEIDVYCDLTNRQKKLYRMLRSQINLVDLIANNKKIGKDDEVESLMNVVMQFRKVCNHPDLFERADTKSAFVFGKYSKIPFTEGVLGKDSNVDYANEIGYSTKNLIEYDLPKLVYDELMSPDWDNDNGINEKQRLIKKLFNIWDPSNWADNSKSIKENKNMSILNFVNEKPNKVQEIFNTNLIKRSIDNRTYITPKTELNQIKNEIYGESEKINSLICPKISANGKLIEVKDQVSKNMYMKSMKRGFYPTAMAPPVDINCSSSRFVSEKEQSFFDSEIRQALTPLSLNTQFDLIQNDVPLNSWPKAEMQPDVLSREFGRSTIRLPSMERFVLESAKLKKLDELLINLKKGDHKCLIYFQMTRMMDLMEEYLTYRQYKYIRLDGSSKLSDRRDLVNDWQTDPELFIFILSTRAGGLGINLTAADTVIFYDSDWNPTIDSQAMDRAHRLGQTRQVTVYRLLVRGTVEERMRDRAKQKEHVQQVVMEGKVENVTEEKKDDKKEMALWLLDDDK